MFARTLLVSLLLLGLISPLYSQTSQQILEASMEKMAAQFYLNPEGQPMYTVFYDGQIVIAPSRLGFSLQGGPGFEKGLEISGSEKKNVDETWKPVWGEVSSIRNHYSQLRVHLIEKVAPRRQLDIVFRVFADGVGFRYEFPRQDGLKNFIVKEELTQFQLTGDHQAFWIPADYDTNEYPYTHCPLSLIDASSLIKNSTDIAVRVAPDPNAVQTPLMLKSAGGIYINIHEAALVDYPAMQLHVDRQSHTLSAALVPDAGGNKGYLRAPGHSPWRTLIISHQATDILASKLILNLNEPSVLTETSWIHPMKFAGVWWEMQTGKSSWSYSDNPDSLSPAGQMIPHGHHGANTLNVKRYIDFAAKNGIQGLLVEGWNTGWEEWFGTWKEEVFDFVTPYPDFDVRGISSYAAARGVKMIMHNETSGSASSYERKIDTAFRFMNQFGYGAVKTGYVGRIIPRGEHHDGQWMVNHYVYVAKKAAQYHVMLDAHEPVRPTGLQRTYPNWMACEAGRGNEYNAFSNGSVPAHETILPFTRLIGGPMDYTPGIFKLKGYVAGVPDRQLHSTLAKQLALYVTLYSPLQMVADLPENYEAHMDAFQFIRDVAVDWDDTKVLEAEPGEYISIARLAKGTGNWFLGAITGENARIAQLKLDFLEPGKKYIATLYLDGEKADWKTNPESYRIIKMAVNSSSTLTLTMAAGGGAAVSIMAQ